MGEKINHSNRAHALLSASGANRWMACTPSARLEEQYGERSTSEYAEEGTLAHTLAEVLIRRDLCETILEETAEELIEDIMNNPRWSEDMPDFVNKYVSYCTEEYHDLLAKDIFTDIKAEVRVNLTRYIPDGFGTIDCVIVGNGTIKIIDLKYGKGVPVSAEWNKQLMIYALGAYELMSPLYDISDIEMSIVQPRLDNISVFRLSADELLDWANNELVQKAELAYAGKGELVSGEHCRFCSVKCICKTFYNEQMEIAKSDFTEPELLTDTEIAGILTKSQEIISYINAVSEYALKKAVSGEKQWPGLKLVEGRSVRKWLVDDDIVAKSLMERSTIFKSEEDYYTKKLKTLTDIEKMIGKKEFSEISDGLIVKAPGKPTLVSENDKRPAIGFSQAVEDFSKDIQ